MRSICSISIAWLAAALPVASLAQPAHVDSDAPDLGTRPVALVLSGGGARGGAHVGVIRALEELRVPIDFIAATSIGAAIGGLYASGLSVAELEEALEGIDWDAAFLNATPRRLRSFRRKRDDDLFLVDQRPGLNEGGFTLPTGVVQGQVIDTVMARLTLPMAHIDDFDELTIPFRAVAGDLVTGDPVVLARGNLGRSIRASMTVPAALAPIEIDGRMLVDGGIAMNLPVEVAQDMGARAVIAIDISDPLSTREELRSVVNVTTQLSSLLTSRGLEPQIELLGDQDVYLRPTFNAEQSSISFSRIGETIQIGYDAVMANSHAFAHLAVTPEEYAAHMAARDDVRSSQLPTIDFIRLNNSSPITDSVLQARMRDVEIGAPLDVAALETSLNRIYGLELYQNVRYSVIEEDDVTGLEIDVIERSWGPNYIQLGAQYSSATDEDALFGIAASYLRTAINPKGGEWRATIFLGDEPSFLLDLYQPIGEEALFFIAPALSIESNQLNLYSGRNLAAEVKVPEALAEIAFGRELMDWGEIRFGFRSGYGETELRVGDPGLVPFDDFRSAELFTRFSIDSLDDVGFPRQGLFASAEWRGSKLDRFSADASYEQLLLEGAIARTWGRHTLLSRVRYDTTVSGMTPTYRLNRIGGFHDLSGLNNEQLSGQHVARVGASYYRRIGDLALFPAFAGVSVEVGNAWDARSDISLKSSIWGGSLWAGVDTPVGPLYLGYGFAEGGDKAFYVFLGRVF